MKDLTPEQINWLYPVSGFYFHERGLEVKRSARLEVGTLKGGEKKKRKKIRALSQRSLHRLAFLVATSSVEFLSLLTLTYGIKWPKKGTIVRGHRNTFLTWMRRVHKPLEYAWFLEFQERGAPHFHILLDMPAPSKEEQKKAGKAWVRIASKTYPETREKMLKVHTFTGRKKKRIWSDIWKKEGALRYMRQYAGKESQKRVPGQYSDVGRFWGTSRNVPTRAEEKTYFRSSEGELRDLLRAKGRDDIASWELIPKYIHT